MSERILVTGGAGYIGSHMVLALVDEGLEPVVVDNLSTGFADAVPHDVPIVPGDVGDAELMQATLRKYGVQAVIHFAASTSVPESVAAPVGYYRNNTANTVHLLQACVAAGVRDLVFSSTAAVYGAVGRSPIREDDPTLPVSPYGASKLMCERVLEDAAKAGMIRYSALRYFNVAGADPACRAGQRTAGATHLIKVACEAAAGKRPGITVYGTDYPTRDGTCVRDFIHVSDLVSAHLEVLKHLRSGGAPLVLNCGYGRGYTVSEVITTVERLAGVPIETRLGPRRPGDVAEVIADPARLRSVIGWSPRHEALEEIVQCALAFERRVGGKAPARRTRARASWTKAASGAASHSSLTA